MYRGRDRDDDGVPDWEEDENYLDEAPRRAPVPVGGASGCLLGMLSLLTGVTVVRLAVRRVLALPSRGQRSRCSLWVRRAPQ